MQKICIVSKIKNKNNSGKQVKNKGKFIIVQGRLKNNNYENENIKHYGMQVEANHVYFGGDKPIKPTASPVQQDLPEELSEYDMLTDEEPF